MKKIAMLPSMLTTCNVICGFASVGYAARGLWAQKLATYGVDVDVNALLSVTSFDRAAWLIMLAMIFDALDGKIARLTNTTSDFGVQLDSLADAVTFGFAPAFLVKAHMTEGFPPRIGWIMSGLFLVCAVLRLARFNVDTEEDEGSHEYFQGLPTPAAAGMVAVLIILHNDLVGNYGLTMRPFIPTFLPIVALALAALMISKIPYVHMAIWLFKDNRPAHYLSLLIFVIVFILLTKPYSVALGFGIYCVSGAVLSARLPQTLTGRWAGPNGDDDDEPAV